MVIVDRNDIRIENDERLGIIGKTGCGKTYLAIDFLNEAARNGCYIVVLDNKGFFGSEKINGKYRFTWKGAGLVRDFNGLYKASQMDLQKIVYRPNPELEANDPKEFGNTMDSFLWWIYRRGNTLLYIDEVASICDSYTIPNGLNAILKRGRELNVGLWYSTQEPVNVHNSLFSQSEQFIVFRTQLQSHRDKMAGYMGDDVRLIIPDKYHFWYFKPEEMDDAIMHDPI
jgi:ABC-type dipeptide/oligopeptide/nickel transport system ATPase component